MMTSLAYTIYSVCADGNVQICKNKFYIHLFYFCISSLPVPHLHSIWIHVYLHSHCMYTLLSIDKYATNGIKLQSKRSHIPTIQYKIELNASWTRKGWNEKWIKSFHIFIFVCLFFVRCHTRWKKMKFQSAHRFGNESARLLFEL